MNFISNFRVVEIIMKGSYLQFFIQSNTVRVFRN